MSNINVSLDVRNWPSNGSDGYTNTNASNGTVYSYAYSGGTDGHGGVDQTASTGTGTITVTLASDPRYTINDVGFSGDIENQLSWAPGSASTIAVITDTDTSTGEGDYSVTVSDSAALCLFPCDPPIKNKPGGPRG